MQFASVGSFFTTEVRLGLIVDIVRRIELI